MIHLPSGPPFSSDTLSALEFPALLAVGAELAATDLGRARFLELRPFSQMPALVQHRARLEEAFRLVGDGRLVPAFEEPIANVLVNLGSGRTETTGPHLVMLAGLLRATWEARQRLLDAEPACPALAELATPLPNLADFERRVRQILDRRGEVRPDASPELSRLRGRVRTLRDGLYQQLQGFVETHREELSDDTVPLRGGRLVLTLQAGSRGRLPGLTHGRSGSGRSFYFEPLEVVEPNNQLQQTIEDEEAERARLLAELVAAARTCFPALEQHALFLGELDLLQASVRFGQLTEGRLAELGSRHQLKLVEARHPLLDPKLADLRRNALGQAGHQGPVVPLDVELSAARRLLVVTGPNAGGKTVALKTVGLLSLAHLCGLPIPAAAGSTVPFMGGLVATVGDEQDLLADRSTFSGRLLRLKEAWDVAGPDALVLLDELGSGTDPAEGAALAISMLEALVERGSLGIITSHLVQIAAVALDLDGAACAAMEFDASTGRPTFHLVPGPPGGSEALALARRLGLPAIWLDRAEELLGPEHRDLKRLLVEVEKSRQELAALRLRLEVELGDAETLRRRLASEELQLRQERKNLGARLQAELEAFRRQVQKRLADEVTQLQAALEQGRRRGLDVDATARLFSAAPTLLEPEVQHATATGPMTPGAGVRHKTLGWRGVLGKLERGRAEVFVHGKRMRCAEEDLVLETSGPEKGPMLPGQRNAMVATTTAGASDADDTGSASELNLIGMRVEPALDILDAFLDRSILAGLPEVRVVHGHGTGRLRQAVRDHLRTHPAAAAQRRGEAREGGDGATVVTLRG